MHFGLDNVRVDGTSTFDIRGHGDGVIPSRESRWWNIGSGCTGVDDTSTYNRYRHGDAVG